MSQLRHEHLIRINDASITPSEWLSRSQLWEGLLHTVLQPQSLDESIDVATVQERSAGVLRREIRRGSLTWVDEAELVTDESVVIRCDSQGKFGGSTFTMRIEEPEPQMLFVRFVYELSGLEEGRTEEEDNARRSAYQTLDVERIREARRHAGRAH